jgi:polysaccharide export outer membrane protein
VAKAPEGGEVLAMTHDVRDYRAGFTQRQSEGQGRVDDGPRSWRDWTRLAVVFTIVALGPATAGVARGQAGSDFVAYPKRLTEAGAFRTNTRQLTFNRMPGLSADYRLGTGDVVQVMIIGLPEMERKIDASGEITIPPGGTVRIGGLTAEEAETAIATLFTARELIVDPQVLLYVSQFESKTIYALGEVDRPGEYAVSFDMTLMDLLMIAGGLDLTATRYGYLHRRAEGSPPVWRPAYAEGDFALLAAHPETPPAGSEVVRIDLQPMKEGGVLAQNLVLRNGDVLYVPRRKLEFAYVIGDVNRAGAFELPNAKRVTAAQVISWAGGPTRTAKLSAGILVRNDERGQRQEFPIDFQAILRGRQPDVDVRADDILFIPGSKGKSVGLGILNAIPSLAMYVLVF